MSPPYLNIWLSLSLILFVLISIILYYSKLHKNSKALLCLCNISFFTSIAVVLLFNETDYGIGGDLNDQGFLTALITKFADYGFFQDGFYKNLFNFYPPLFYYFLAKSASIFQIEPYKMLKIGMVITSIIIPFITYKLWRNLVNSNTALIISFSILIYQDWHKTAAWIGLVMAIPFWLYYVEGIIAKKNFSPIQFLWAGILGAIIFQLQYYWFLTLTFASIIASFTNFYLKRDKKSFYQGWYHRIIVYSLSVLLSLNYILPYLFSMIKNGSEPMQNKWYDDGMGNLPFQFLDSNFTSFFWLLGLIYIIIISRRNKIALYLCVLLLSAYCWYGIGIVLVLLKMPILHFKVLYPIRCLLTVMSLYSLAHLLYKKTFSYKYRYQLHSIGFILLLFFGFAYQRMDSEAAINTKFPQHEIEVFKNLTNNQYKNKTILTSKSTERLLSYLPIFTFYNWIHYAHPASLHQTRSKYLVKLASIKDAEVFALALMNNKYDKIDYLYFDSPSNQIQIAIDSFPFLNVFDITFPNYLLDKPYFTTKKKGNYSLYTIIHSNNFIKSKKITLSSLTNANLITYFGLITLLKNDLDLKLLNYSLPQLSSELTKRINANKLSLKEILRLNQIIPKESNLKVSINKFLDPILWSLSRSYSIDSLITKGKVETINNLKILKMSPDATLGYNIFGPYTSLNPGIYQIKFKIKTNNHLSKDEILILDLFSAGIVYDTKVIHGTDFKSNSEYQSFDLFLNTSIKINQMEFRVQYLGKEIIWFESIEVFKYNN